MNNAQVIKKFASDAKKMGEVVLAQNSTIASQGAKIAELEKLASEKPKTYQFQPERLQKAANAAASVYANRPGSVMSADSYARVFSTNPEATLDTIIKLASDLAAANVVKANNSQFAPAGNGGVQKEASADSVAGIDSCTSAFDQAFGTGSK